MRLLILGPPGAGKGTQARLIAERFGIPAISTGDIFRANVRDRTPLGVKVKAIMDAGDYVPDELTNQLVRDRLAEPDATDGFLLDGYPRTADQVRELDTILEQQGHPLQHVLELTVDTEEVVGRLLRRAETDGRSDDTEDVIRRRQQVYAAETAPLVDTYRERGLLVQVDGMGAVEEVSERVLAALEAREPGAAAGTSAPSASA
jgi:adenylate kinase